MGYGAILGQTPTIQENPETLATKVSYDNSQTSGVINGNNVQEALDDLSNYASNNITSINGNIATINQNIENIGNSLYELKTTTMTSATISSSKNFKFCILSFTFKIASSNFISTIVLNPRTSEATYWFSYGQSGLGSYIVSTTNKSLFFNASSIYELSSLKANIIFFY